MDEGGVTHARFRLTDGRQLQGADLSTAVTGQRVVGFDNERGKGDHCHLDGRQQHYSFATVEQLIEDFIAAVEQRRTP